MNDWLVFRIFTSSNEFIGQNLIFKMRSRGIESFTGFPQIPEIYDFEVERASSPDWDTSYGRQRPLKDEWRFGSRQGNWHTVRNRDDIERSGSIYIPDSVASDNNRVFILLPMFPQSRNASSWLACANPSWISSSSIKSHDLTTMKRQN